ncbi:hypothetical protein CMI47_22285 [Candidatus Pacearchaeota archaeon]|nr:hypothetical protein [Candidatus Pacearchaeota archaeon]|tara:strand:- start:10743 stop:11363 length:621 start_codon:yes stop_codon:yes gene_type:complete
MKLEEGLAELRKNSKERKFDQSVDLIVNFKGVDGRKDNINVIAEVPHKLKDKKVCAFLAKKTDKVDVITEPEFAKYKDKGELAKLVKEYDFFIAFAGLMPKVATTFGKALGPAGKMPSPQLGILPQENDEAIEKVLEKISKSFKIRAKEASIKLSIGKEKMKDEDIVENVKSVYTAIVNALPTKKENVKNVMIKFTMGKPVKVEVN